MNTAFPLFPVTILTIAAWLVTLIFSKWGVLQVKTHRKFWNYLLLISFFVSGLLGILSVVKVNYKLEIPGYDQLMQWHVSFGIAMVIISFFHLSWHLRYYLGFSKEKPVRKVKSELKRPEFIRLHLFRLGFATIICQVIFIREFISVLAGNELVTGLVLSAWMLLTGWGAFTGRKADYSALTDKRLFITIVMLPVFTIVNTMLLYLLKNLLFPPGTLVGLGASLTAILLLLFPVCFLSGWLFTGISSVWSKTENLQMAGKSYAFESLGSLAGGVVFTVILGRYFNSFQILAIALTVILLAGAFLHSGKGGRINFWYLTAGIILPVLIFAFNPEIQIKKLLFPNQEILISKSTRYGNLTVTAQAGQINLYANNRLMFYTHNTMMNEEAVHFAMIQHDNPKKVLLVSGGISGMINEIEKYGVDEITYLEINPEIFNALPEFADSLESNFKVRIVKTDIRNFIASNDEKFDVILINLPEPASLAMNRFYTVEFFELLKNHCNEKTVVCTGLPSTANYAEPEAFDENSSLWNTLGSCFTNRLLLTGERNYFIASDAELLGRITERIAQKNIETTYVNRYYLDDALLAQRGRSLVSAFGTDAPVNRDFSPVMFEKQIGHWLSIFNTGYNLLAIIVALLFILIFFSAGKINAGLYTGGFTAASLEVAFLIVWQVWFGSLYISAAIFFAVFMGGLAAGSFTEWKTDFRLIKKYYLLQFGLALFAILLPLIISFTGNFPDFKIPVQLMILSLVFILATAVGQLFLMANKLQHSGFGVVAARSYSIDLAGSAFGAFFTSIVLIPVIGLTKTCFVVAGLNIISGLLAFSKQNE